MPSTFIEHESRYSDFIKFATKDVPDESVSADEDSAGSKFPSLSFLRIELERVRAGMGDFIIRISSPKFSSIKSNTVLSVRGGRNMTKYDEVRKLAELVGAEMTKRGDKTFVWANLDTEHLADMIAGTLKYFSGNVNVENLKFTTEALA